MTTGTVRRLFVCAFAAFVFAPLAHAALPRLQPMQTLRPEDSEVFPDPNEFPQVPYFGTSVALDQNVILSGMPGASDLQGRVAVFTKNAAGKWLRTATLKASDAANNAEFGNVVALAGGRALVASNTGVYVFAVTNGTWQQKQKLAFDGAVHVGDLAWNGTIAIVGVGGLDDQFAPHNGAYAFSLTSAGQLQRIAKFNAHDTVTNDLFGSRVAQSGTLVAITAPGYNSDQGAAYVFSCTATGCRERQKLLANDGQPGDNFGASVDLRSRVLVVGAPAAEATSQQADGAIGAGYVFVRPNDEWLESQKLGLTASQSTPYWALGWAVALAGDRVLISAPGLGGFASGQVFVFDYSGGTLVPTHVLERWDGYGTSLEFVSNRVVVGFPDDGGAPPVGFADIYYLPPPIP